MAPPVYQPTKARLIDLVIGGVSWATRTTVGTYQELNASFHVKEFRCYEDICKPYFTAEVVIETLQNEYEPWLFPTAEVRLTWESPRSDGGPTKIYDQRYRVFSYESTPLDGGHMARMEHKVSLIGQEYYNDKHNVVIQNFHNLTGTAAATAVHNNYMADRGAMSATTSTGLIGQDSMKHQTINKKPIKAIQDILDRCIWSQYPSCAPTYFKDVDGYVIAPLQEIMETSAVLESFDHKTAAGGHLPNAFGGYNIIHHLRPVAPAGEATTGVRASEISGLSKGTSFFDAKTKNMIVSGADFGADAYLSKIPNSTSARQTLNEARKSYMGGQNMFHVIDELLQQRSVDKNGPGKFNSKQEAFLTAVTYAPKYWISVPGQTGLNVTCGKRIRISYPFFGTLQTKVLFVPRLIHEVKFTEDVDRKAVNQHAKTDIYAVQWG